MNLAILPPKFVTHGLLKKTSVKRYMLNKIQNIMSILDNIMYSGQIFSFFAWRGNIFVHE